MAGLFLVATPAPALTEPMGPPLLPLEAADDGLEGDYNRVGDFKMPTSAGAGAQEVAIRVTLNRMYIASNEDHSQCRVRQGLPDLQVFEGQARYLGPPEVFDNNASSDPKWVGAKLQCTPFYRDWNASALAAELGISQAEADTIYYYGAEVVPCSIHAVQQATQSCVESANEDCFSDPLEVRTALWGDVWPFFGLVSLSDVGKMVDAFKSVPFVPGDPSYSRPPSGAANKWRSMLRDNEGAPETDINFMDIARVLDGFKKLAYPELGPVDCSGGLAVFALGTPVRGGTVSLKAVEVNGVPLPSPTNTVTVAAGDTILAQVFISGWGDEIDNVRIWQWAVLGEAGSTSGISGTILPLGWPDTPDDGGFIEVGLVCTSGPNVGLRCSNSVRDCLAADLCDCLNPDFIMCRFDGLICTVDNADSLKYRYGCILFDDFGVVDDGSDFSAGSLILEVSQDACGTFTFAMDSDPASNFLTTPAPEQTIHPVTQDLVIKVECDPPLLPLEAADDGLDADYNRVGDFKMPTSAVAGSQDVAVRVKLIRMYTTEDDLETEFVELSCPVRPESTCIHNNSISCTEDADCRPGGVCEPNCGGSLSYCLGVLQSFEGQVRYLGPPEAFRNNSYVVNWWVGAKLQCAPFYRDWSPAVLQADFPDRCSHRSNSSCSTDAECQPGGACEPDDCNSRAVCVSVDADTIYYYGAEVVPCSIHVIQQATQSCVESASPDDCFSDPLEVRTVLWGDIWPIPPGGVVSFTDIGKLIEAFKGIPFDAGDPDAIPPIPPSGGPNKWRAMLRKNEGAPDGNITFSDISSAVDAFKTIAYSADGPVDCP